MSRKFEVFLADEPDLEQIVPPLGWERLAVHQIIESWWPPDSDQ